MKPAKNKSNIMEWADKKYEESKKTITDYIAQGIKTGTAFHLVMDSSLLGAGYRAQMRRDLNLSIFD